MKDAALAVAVMLMAGLSATPPAAAQEEVPVPPATPDGERAPEPPKNELTRAEFEAAVRRPGFNPSCLQLVDVGRGIMAALAADKHGNSTVGTGFAVEVCTPANWIARKMAEAKRQYRPLAWNDLEEQDRVKVLHVLALPDRTTNRNVENGDNVVHVVLRHPDDKKREILIVQPLFTRPFGVEQTNRRGDKATLDGLEAAFPFDGLATVRDEKGEFLVTVVGRLQEKNFKIKEKHLDDLGLSEH
jgi:hypothetical protein